MKIKGQFLLLFYCHLIVLTIQQEVLLLSEFITRPVLYF